ncbi:copper resistance CopC/CopD family protein [Rhodococcus zopfii]|uniref:copper resistance CopC/CopD family protein n=1 Tax=Rhodococcus zopfii TaxID=43772 RepID=UPI0009FA6CB4|nr:copper resistance protein CopC [Rhodococcus zopfii]
MPDRTTLHRSVVPILVLLAVAAAWPGAGVAAAHAVLVGADPAYGVALETSPASMTVSFDEPVTAVGNTVTVVDSGGRRVDDGQARSADGGRSVVVALQPDLPVGTYLASWAVLSSDGHVVGGSSVFGVGGPPDLSAGDPPRDPTTVAADTMSRLLGALGYLGVALAVGIPIVVLSVWRRGREVPAVTQLVRIGGWLTAGVSVAIFVALPARLAGTSGWADPAIWRQATESSVGITMLVRTIGAVALALAWPRIPVVLPAAALTIVSTAAAGHAVSGDAWVGALASTTVHVAAMAVWVGGLVLSVVVWRNQERDRLLAGFARIAFWSLLAVAGTGLYQAWRSVDPPDSLWTTTWGRLLLAKIVLVIAVLAAAGLVRTLLLRRRPVGRLLRLELALQLAILLVTSILVGAVPARDAYDPPDTLLVQLGPLTAEVAVDGTGAGDQELTVRLAAADGTPVEALELDGVLTRPDGDLGPVEVSFRRVEPVELGPTYFVSNSARVPLAGTWHLRVTVRVDRTTGYAATVPYRVW